MVFNFLYTKHAEYFSVLKAIIPVSWQINLPSYFQY